MYRGRDQQERDERTREPAAVEAEQYRRTANDFGGEDRLCGAGRQSMSLQPSGESGNCEDEMLKARVRQPHRAEGQSQQQGPVLLRREDGCEGARFN